MDFFLSYINCDLVIGAVYSFKSILNHFESPLHQRKHIMLDIFECFRKIQFEALNHINKIYRDIKMLYKQAFTSAPNKYYWQNN